jgi:hypothetical protein
VSTPYLAALAVTAALLAGLGLSGCGDTTTSDYDYRRATAEVPQIVPVPTPAYEPPRFGTIGVYGE